MEEAWIWAKPLVRKINRAKKRTYTNQFNELLTVKKKAGSWFIILQKAQTVVMAWISKVVPKKVNYNHLTKGWKYVYIYIYRNLHCNQCLALESFISSECKKHGLQFIIHLVTTCRYGKVLLGLKPHSITISNPAEVLNLHFCCNKILKSPPF